MTTIPQYIKIMRDAQWEIAQALGADFSQANKEMRALMLSNLALQATLIKVLVDKGVISNQELLTLLNAVRAGSHTVLAEEPGTPVYWTDTDPVTGI